MQQLIEILKVFVKNDTASWNNTTAQAIIAFIKKIASPSAIEKFAKVLSDVYKGLCAYDKAFDDDNTFLQKEE